MVETQKISVSPSTTGLLKIVAVVLALILLYTIREIVLILLISMVLASAMDPLVDWLYRRAKFPRGLSVILVYLIFITFVGGVFYFVIPPIVSQFSDLGARLENFRSELSERASSVADVLRQLGAEKGLQNLGQSLSNITSNFFRTTLGVFSGFIELIAVLAISFYLISSESGMKNFIKSLVPLRHQAYAVRLTDRVQKKIAYWLLGQVILSGFIFLLTFIGLTALGVKNALALALLAGLLEIVPYLGPILSAVPAVFLAFLQSPPLALFVLILYVVVQQIENYVLVPKIMGRTVGANPVIILVAVLVGFKLAGIVGMLLAVPVVAAVTVFLADLRDTREQT